MFTGLSAFPITPFKQEVIDYKAFKGLVENLGGVVLQFFPKSQKIFVGVSAVNSCGVDDVDEGRRALNMAQEGKT